MLGPGSYIPATESRTHVGPCRSGTVTTHHTKNTPTVEKGESAPASQRAAAPQAQPGWSAEPRLARRATPRRALPATPGLPEGPAVPGEALQPAGRLEAQ